MLHQPGSVHCSRYSHLVDKQLTVDSTLKIGFTISNHSSKCTVFELGASDAGRHTDRTVGWIAALLNDPTSVARGHNKSSSIALTDINCTRTADVDVDVLELSGRRRDEERRHMSTLH